MRVAILTSLRHDVASRTLPILARHPRIEPVMVVFCEGHYRGRRAKLKRDLRKLRRIGPLGVLTGLRLRGWYTGNPAEDLFDVARRHDVPVETTPRTNARRTSELLRRSGARLALSLGNSYIARRIYSTPELGMLNVHGEILPRFQGAASVIWAIHEGVAETGFTVHQIDRGIDTGAIVYQERFPIELHPTLRETVMVNSLEISRRVPGALAEVVGDYERHRARATVQSGGKSYTTPTYWQFRRMVRQHRRMYRESVASQ